MTDDAAIRSQYEALPYPARDPRDEARRLITGSPSHLLEIRHYIFGGGWPIGRPARALFAGGGTGDALVMLATQARAAGLALDCVYLDPSEASRKVAEARCAARDLRGIRFVTGSLLDLVSLGLSDFDYIDCCGVLHHLADPAAGLAALAGAVGPGGGIGMMVYGRFGRTGVYDLQDVLRRLIPDDQPPLRRAAAARRLIASLPTTNWFRRNPMVQDHLVGGDAGLYDLLLHARDRPFTAGGVFDLADHAGLTIAAMIEPLRYDPALYLTDLATKSVAATLSPRDAADLAELLAGNLIRHVAYLTRPGHPPALRPDDPAAIPVLRDVAGNDLARGINPDFTIEATVDQLSLRLPVPRASAAILQRIDGVRSLAEIEADIAAGPWPKLRGPAFTAEFLALYRVLNGLNRLLLLRPPTPANP